MGDHQRAKFAYMVPVFDGEMPEGNPDEPTVPLIYKVPVEKVETFRKMNNFIATEWRAFYSILDTTTGSWRWDD